MICKVCGEQKPDKRATSAEIPPITHTTQTGPIWVGYSLRSYLSKGPPPKELKGTLNLLGSPLFFQFKYTEQNKS